MNWVEINKINKYNIDDIKIIENIDSLSQIFNILPININDYKMKICFKNHNIGYYMNWHIDDCVKIKKKNNGKFKLNHGKGIFYENEKYLLLYQNKLPEYTLLYYNNIDNIIGGDLIMFPDFKIKPKCNMVVLFPSYIPHCVSKLNSGTRKNVIIKFYKK